ncbi:MAG TPA: hypothetical protein VGR67_09095 [Candidatus Polarisedimenticolia bacterium]|jgi:hypothetical protein|nr:hypothetical protein [Candidatus Polarisedimenticolia bacterium]
MKTPFPSFEIEFTKEGDPFGDSDAVTDKIARQAPLTDLFVISHGWNNDLADARTLYETFFKRVGEVAKAGIIPGLSQRSFGVLGIYWPSKKFTEKDLIPGGGSASAAPQNTDAVIRILEELKNDPVRLGKRSVDAAKAKKIDRAKELLSKLDDPGAQEEFVAILRAVLQPGAAHAEDASDAFFKSSPKKLFADLDGGVQAPRAAGGGGAADVGSGEGAAGIKDLFSGVVGAARRMANFATYYQMKNRAGIVGKDGVAKMLRAIRKRKPEMGLHLIGHSFGGRVVTAAADALDANTSKVTLTLLQAAYSHNGLASKFDGQHDGAFRGLVSKKRASGPIIITHTKNDKAVGVAYPLASRLANAKASAFGTANDPYGGMGRNGAQFTPEVSASFDSLRDFGELKSTPYDFKPGAIYNLNADQFIKDHSDICKQEVAAALLSVVLGA